MSSSDATGETSASLQNIPATYARLKRQYQQNLDRITPHVFYRWVGTTVAVAIFELRILYAQGVRVPPNIFEFHHSFGILPSACLIYTVVYWSVTLSLINISLSPHMILYSLL
jgi:hypothetical protein